MAMAIMISEGFDAYEGKGEHFESGSFALASLKVTDECHYISPDIDIYVSRTEGGKWLVRVNGADLVFQQRPHFTVPARTLAVSDKSG